jgi:hypothetical protein
LLYESFLEVREDASRSIVGSSRALAYAVALSYRPLSEAREYLSKIAQSGVPWSAELAQIIEQTAKPTTIAALQCGAKAFGQNGSRSNTLTNNLRIVSKPNITIQRG